ncbi:MAG: hypothetical protein SFU98_09945 [Leptospiraceae bacterium]|nr:hypothetical protein [Leptospiraceae bacterium]
MKVFLAILITIPFHSIFASYYATCTLEATIKNINSKEVFNSERKIYEKEATFSINKFVKGGGHEENHCKDFKGKVFKEKLSSKKSIQLKARDKFKIYYEFVASEIVENDKAVGMHETTTWGLEPVKD